MPFVETRLISPTTLTTSAASALYTVPTGYSAIIKQLVVTNITGTAATFTFYIGAASAGNALFSGTSVAANDTVIINLSQVLSTGEVLRALASTGSALNLTVSGVINDGPLASTATYIPDNAITSAKIAAGAIVNDDVNGSAAIAQTKIANLTSDLALKAPLASPSFTGTPSLPVGTTAATQIAGNNTTAVATTAFVTTAVSNISAGSVPNFLAYLSGGNGSATSGATIAYNTEVYDDTNNLLNGVFTVPTGQAGIYSFTSHQNAYNIGTTGIIRGCIVTTGSYANTYFGSSAPANGGTDTYVEVSLITKLAVGDTVKCIWSVPATGTYSAGFGYNSFSGARIA